MVAQTSTYPGGLPHLDGAVTEIQDRIGTGSEGVLTFGARPFGITDTDVTTGAVINWEALPMPTARLFSAFSTGAVPKYLNRYKRKQNAKIDRLKMSIASMKHFNLGASSVFSHRNLMFA